MALHLLALPPEVRNRIYEYALTRDDGVSYRKDNYGKGWLCQYMGEIGDDDYDGEIVQIPDEPDEDLDDDLDGDLDDDMNGDLNDDMEDDMDDDMDDDMEYNMVVGKMFKHNNMEVEKIFKHNNKNVEKISKYDDKKAGKISEHESKSVNGQVHGAKKRSGLVTEVYGECLVSKGGKDLLANQLQFVCRELYQETNRLTLRLNKIVFSCPKGYALELCVRFLRRLAPESMRQIMAVAIKHNNDSRDAPIPLLIPFCHINPKLRIDVHDGGLESLHDVISLSCDYQRLYGRNIPFLKRLDPSKWQKRDGPKMPCTPLPDNIRLLFSYGTFSKKQLAKFVKECNIIQHDILPKLKGGHNCFLKFLQEFMEVGV